jgi:hypothetical protein
MSKRSTHRLYVTVSEARHVRSSEAQAALRAIARTCGIDVDGIDAEIAAERRKSQPRCAPWKRKAVRNPRDFARRHRVGISICNRGAVNDPTFALRRGQPRHPCCQTAALLHINGGFLRLWSHTVTG